MLEETIGGADWTDERTRLVEGVRALLWDAAERLDDLYHRHGVGDGTEMEKTARTLDGVSEQLGALAGLSEREQETDPRAHPWLRVNVTVYDEMNRRIS